MTMTPFADLQAAMNTAVVDLLADAVADFGGGVTVLGLFRQAPAEAFGVVGRACPTFQAHSTDLAASPIDAPVSINGRALHGR